MNPEESEQTKLLREILKWIRFAGSKEVKSILVTSLNTEQKKLVYQLSDGNHGTVEIAKIVAIGSNATIADMWQTWLKQGLGESIPVKGGTRFKRSFDLEEFGIEVPKLKEKEKEETGIQSTLEKGTAEQKREAANA